MRHRNSRQKHLSLILLAAAALLLGYWLGKQWQRHQLEATGMRLPAKPLVLSSGQLGPTLEHATIGHWILVLVGDPDPACEALLRTHIETWNRLADTPKLQQSLRLVRLAAWPDTPDSLWRHIDWATAQVLPPSRRATLADALHLPTDTATSCRGDQAVTALIGPDRRLYAWLPLDKPAQMAESLRLLYHHIDDMNTDDTIPGWRDRLNTALLRILPQHLLSHGMYHLARSEIGWLKDLLIRHVITHYDVDMQDALIEDPYTYPSFNAFFTRALKPGARPITPEGMASPTDGKVSQTGRIRHDRLIQAKGHEYSLYALLAGDGFMASQFESGTFTTIYLAPRDYHRIHMPLDGTLREMVFVPGDLFSVSKATTQLVPGLFARNERVILLFDTDRGPMTLVLVGAIFVGNMETVWHGEVRSPDGSIARWIYEGDEAPHFSRGEEIARFNMGSTVIVLNTQHAVDPVNGLIGHRVRMGEKIAD